MKKGFTLIELSIVLIIIGLVLGMVFKGRYLIDLVKVKYTAVQYNKIQSAMFAFYTRYGFYPGDGCLVSNPLTVHDCNGQKNGVLDRYSEREAFWHLLVDITNILPVNDRRSILSDKWEITYEGVYGKYGNWLKNEGDIRIVCAVDNLIDDGRNRGGLIRSSSSYNSSTDCWSLSGTTETWFYILP